MPAVASEPEANPAAAGLATLVSDFDLHQQPLCVTVIE